MSLHTAGEELSAKTIIIFSCCALAATLFGGLMSGLTVGLASLDRLSLEIDAKGDEAARKSAEKIFPIIDKHHWMLVTLLLCNAAAMESTFVFGRTLAIMGSYCSFCDSSPDVRRNLTPGYLHWAELSQDS